MMKSRKLPKTLHEYLYLRILRSNNFNCTTTAKAPKGFPMNQILEAPLNDEVVASFITGIYEYASTRSFVFLCYLRVLSLCELRTTSNAY